MCGAICPIPLGSYRYRKRRGSGASLMIDVDVFPLAVNRELDKWKEQGERERRWFTLGDAAEAVDEEDLRDLIRSFGAVEFRKAVRRTGMLDVVVRKSRVSEMFGWFQRLLPKTGNFFELFERHAVTMVSAGNALARLLPRGARRLSISARSSSASMTPTRSSARCCRPSARPSSPRSIAARSPA